MRRYVYVGLPSEGERVAPPAPSPIAEAFAALPPGEEIALACDDGSRIRLVSELSLLGERSLRDVDRGDRLYFTVVHGNLTFTAYQDRRTARSARSSSRFRGSLRSRARRSSPTIRRRRR